MRDNSLILESVVLQHRTNGHFKEYRIKLCDENDGRGGFSVYKQWGRIANMNRDDNKTFLTWVSVENYFNDIKRAKLAKGYVECININENPKVLEKRISETITANQEEAATRLALRLEKYFPVKTKKLKSQ